MSTHYKMLFSLFLAATMTFMSCNEDPDPLPPDPTPTGPIIEISGFTFTDEQGVPTSSVDPTDWQLDDVWPDEVNDLFEDLPALCAPSSEYAMTAFPNPAPDGFLLSPTFPAGSTYSFRMVDEDLNIVTQLDNANYPAVPFSDVSAEVDTFRIYYIFTDPANCVFQGHGDIILQ